IPHLLGGALHKLLEAGGEGGAEDAGLAEDAALVGDELLPRLGRRLLGQRPRLQRELAADVERLEVLAVLPLDRILNRPGDAAGRDRNQSELERDAEHHDVRVQFAAETLLAEVGKILREGVDRKST